MQTQRVAYLFACIGRYTAVTVFTILVGFFGENKAFARQAGQIIFTEDFGTGVFPTGQPLPNGVTNFIFFEPPQPADFDDTAPNNGIVDDGFYTIGNNTQQAFSSWANIQDNTPGDVNGLMLIVNARENELVNGQVVEDEFYRQTIPLTSNTSFDFLASLVPANSAADEEFCRTNFGALILPNVRFTIQALDGTILSETVTGEIPFNANPQFTEFSLTFTTPSTTSDVQIVLSNIAQGGCGNDIAIDDIIFRVSITASAVDDAIEVTDASSGVPNVLNIVANDLLNGAPFPLPGSPGSNTTLSLASGSSLPPQLTFDTATGNVGIVAGTSNGVFSFDYQICETSAEINCDIGNVAVTVSQPPPQFTQGVGVCPAGQVAVAELGRVLNAIDSRGEPVGGDSLPELVGSFLADGTVTPGFNDPNDGVILKFFGSADLDFTSDSNLLIPQNSLITLVLGPIRSTDATARIEASVNGTDFAPVPPGNIAFGGSAGPPFNQPDTMRHLNVTVPQGGLRYIRIRRLTGGFRVGGAQRTEICAPTGQAVVAFDDEVVTINVDAANPNLLNVVTNDRLNDNPFTTFFLSIAPGSSLPSGLTFNTQTGAVGTLAGASDGTFTFDYQICETSAQTSCDIGRVTVTIDAQGLGAGNGTCPAGQVAFSQLGFAVNAIESNGATVSGPQLPELVGSFLNDGTIRTTQNDPNDGVVETFFPAIDLDFTGDSAALIPENGTITLVLGPVFNNQGAATLRASVDGVSFVPVAQGNLNFGTAAGPPFNQSNTMRHLEITVPAGGLRYVRVDQTSGGLRVGGARRTQICQAATGPTGPQLEALKTVEALSNASFSIPGEEVLYTISISNIGNSPVDADTIFLIDALPPETTFINSGFTDPAGFESLLPIEFTQTNGAALDFDFNRDIGFALSGATLSSFSDCSSPSTLIPGANPDVRFICFNPKGSLAAANPDPSVFFRFRVRIN